MKTNTKQRKSKAAAPQTPPFRFGEHRFPLIIIFLFATALYLQSVTYDYVLDDKMVITQNQFTQQGIDGIKDIFRYESFRGYFGEQTTLLEGDRYRPLSIASFAMEKSITGGSKSVSHLINVLLYALTGILLYRVLFMFFPRRNEERWFASVPFLATMFFMVHPLHVEVVANIKGRDEILALIGEMGSLYFSFKYIEKNKNRFLLFSFISILLAMLSKEGAITFLAVVPLTIHFFTWASGWKKFLVTLPVLAAFIFYLAMRVNAIGYLLSDTEVTDLMNNPFYGLSFGEKTATVFYTLLEYLRLHFVPYPLTHDYYPYQVPVVGWNNWRALLSLAIHLGLLVVIIKGWKKKTTWAWSAAYYIITLSIVSNLVVSVGTFMNERFAYHASLGFCVALAWLLSGKSQAKIPKNAALMIAAVVILSFSFITLNRLPDWKSEKALDNSAIRFSPNSARSNCFYGVSIWQNVYVSIPPENIQRRLAVLDSMRPWFEKSVQILPGYAAAQTMRAGVAAEYHKINQNMDSLIAVFESINRSGVNEPFVINYLNYLNGSVNNPQDAAKLASFYNRMIAFYSPGTSLHNQYQAFSNAISTSPSAR